MIRVSHSVLAQWLDQVADGLEAGLQAAEAVALARKLPGGASEALQEAFRHGSSWTASLGESGLELSVAELAVLQASEVSGSLPRSMRRLAAARVERHRLQRRVMMATLYPTFLIHFSALVFSVTYLVNGRMAAFFVSAGMVIVPFWLLAVFGFCLGRYAPRLLRHISRVFPLFSGYRKNWDMGVFCDTLATCLRAGMPVDAAWEASVSAADDPRIDRMGNAALRSIRSGGVASAGIAEAGGSLPGSLLQIYRTGETTGSLEQNLEAAAERYFKDARSRLTLASIAYPKILLVAVLGYAAYKIVVFYQGYFERITEMGS